jgi:hypothetical protein
MGTPESFYDDLSNEMLEGGFIPRFTILEYDGSLVPRNYNNQNIIPDEMLFLLKEHFNMAFDLNSCINGELNKHVAVMPTSEALAAIRAYDEYCIAQTNQAHAANLPTSGIWSRVKEHVPQIAALIACGVNRYSPVLTLEHFEIAKAIVEPSLKKLCSKVARGDTGTGDSRLESEIDKYVGRFHSEGWAFVSQHKIASKVAFDAGLIQVSCMRAYCAMRSVFRNHKLGANKAFNDTLAIMTRDGKFLNVPKSPTTFGFDCVRPI